ncbi:MAG: hypothetical protein PVG22_04210 [Chromatiales bacterium]|jgi:hypothetical protein
MKAAKREIQQRIAYETARILTEYQISDQVFAMQKAASRLGINDKRLLPNREEISLAIRQQQRLFRGNEQESALVKLRNAALQAMQFLVRFKPLLVGPVFEGTADINSPVRLHLFADTPEEVIFTLSDLHIPWQERDRIMRFSGGNRKNMPGFQFNANGVMFELVILPKQGPFSKPLDPLDHHPTQGITSKQLKTLINQR